MLNETQLRDVLYNMSPNSGAKAEYARGVVVGVMAALMAEGRTFEYAAIIASENMPRTIVYDSIPASWLESFAIKDLNPPKYKVNNCKVWERSTGR